MDLERLKCCISVTNIQSFITLIIVSMIWSPTTTSTVASRITQNLKHVVPGHAEVFFPTPTVENVYKEWKPVDFGHPLRDATLYYAPPSLKRVHLDGRSSAESRSLADDFGGDKTTAEELFPVVIAAEPRRDPSEHDYSVYGSPGVDYFKLYSQPAMKIPAHSVPLEDGREDPNLALQRDYFNPPSAGVAATLGSGELPPGHGDTDRRRSDFGGGIRYIDPPNRQPEKKSYFYYSENSPHYHYQERLTTSSGKRENPGIGLRYAPSVTADTASVTTTTVTPVTKSPPKAGSDLDGLGTSPNAVVYSFENEFGQKAKVGVILDEEDLTPDASTLVSHGAGRPAAGPFLVGAPETPEPLRAIPLAKDTSTFAGPQVKTYPLGAPYKLPERPKFFPVQSRPPIYKTRPNRLEGVFGPALPERPNPNTVAFPDDHEYGQPKVWQQDDSDRRKNEVSEEDPGHFVYKVDREMEFRRPAVILTVGNSNELYRPDDPTDHVWKPEDRNLEDNHSTQTEKPFPYEFLGRPSHTSENDESSAITISSLSNLKNSEDEAKAIVKIDGDVSRAASKTLPDEIVSPDVPDAPVGSGVATARAEHSSFLGIPLELPVEMKKGSETTESLPETHPEVDVVAGSSGRAVKDREAPQDGVPTEEVTTSSPKAGPAQTPLKIKGDVRQTNRSTHEYLTRLLHFLGGPRQGQPPPQGLQKQSQRAHSEPS